MGAKTANASWVESFKNLEILKRPYYIAMLIRSLSIRACHATQTVHSRRLSIRVSRQTCQILQCSCCVIVDLCFNFILTIPSYLSHLPYQNHFYQRKEMDSFVWFWMRAGFQLTHHLFGSHSQPILEIYYFLWNLPRYFRRSRICSKEIRHLSVTSIVVTVHDWYWKLSDHAAMETEWPPYRENYFNLVVEKLLMFLQIPSY